MVLRIHAYEIKDEGDAIQTLVLQMPSSFAGMEGRRLRRMAFKHRRPARESWPPLLCLCTRLQGHGQATALSPRISERHVTFPGCCAHH